MERQLYTALTATSSWVDDVENTLFSGPALLTENAETQLSNHEVWNQRLTKNCPDDAHTHRDICERGETLALQALGKEVAEVTREVNHSQGQQEGAVGLSEEEKDVMKDTLDCLTRRLGALDSALERRCDAMRKKMLELAAFQVSVLGLVLLGMLQLYIMTSRPVSLSDGDAASVHCARRK